MFINARINMYKNEVNKIFLFFKHIFKIIYLWTHDDRLFNTDVNKINMDIEYISFLEKIKRVIGFYSNLFVLLFKLFNMDLW